MSKLDERRNEIRGMNMSAAQAELKRLRRQLFNLRIQMERGEVKDTSQFRKTRKDIARVMHHMGDLNNEALVSAAGGLDHADVATPDVATPAATGAEE